MKEKLKELSKSTTAKIIASIIVPGGFIIWGVYEINKRIKGRHRDVESSTRTDTDDDQARSVD